MTDDIPTFEVTGHKIITRKPRTVIAGMVMSQEAFIEIDTRVMRQQFIKELMFHIGQKNIIVKVAQESKRVRAGEQA